MLPRSLVLVVVAGCAFEPRGGNRPGDGDGGDAADADTSDGAADDATLDGAAVDSTMTIDGALVDAPAPVIDGAVPDCPTGYVTHASGTYRLVATTATWNAARADCADDDDGGAFRMRTHLVVMSGEAERMAVRSTFAGPKLWLGVSDRVMTGTWRWVTLEDTNGYPPATGAPWKGGQPNNGSGGAEDCVIMEGNGLWDDRQCGNDTEAYVCECDAYDEVASQSDPQM